jgi:glutamate dehydrogenase (NAD(P)+)
MLKVTPTAVPAGSVQRSNFPHGRWTSCVDRFSNLTGIYEPEGLDPFQIIDNKKQTGSVVGFPDAQAISNADLLILDVDFLVPAALENAITGRNAPQIKAHVIAELASGPTTPDADEILFQNSVYVLPDFLCNAGGVTVSYFEMV